MFAELVPNIKVTLRHPNTSEQKVPIYTNFAQWKFCHNFSSFSECHVNTFTSNRKTNESKPNLWNLRCLGLGLGPGGGRKFGRESWGRKNDHDHRSSLLQSLWRWPLVAHLLESNVTFVEAEYVNIFAELGWSLLQYQLLLYCKTLHTVPECLIRSMEWYYFGRWLLLTILDYLNFGVYWRIWGCFFPITLVF